MIFQLKAYLQFLRTSTNQYGVHSPFVYQLITQCFYDSASKEWYGQLQQYRASLLKNRTTIVVEDFGAGSKLLKHRHRNVSHIAKNAGISLKRAQLLGRLCNYFSVDNVLEIGTSLGISTASMYVSNKNRTITTLEGCTATAEVATNNFEKFTFKNISLLLGNFDNTLPKALENNTYDLVFFDGNHQKKPTLNYFEQCLQHIHNESIFIFDDIYWSKGMSDAWLQIQKHPKVSVSIDTFYWGIVFFRKEQEKQHFVIRI
jgi:predicted O-methyltransferase YrrM